VTAQRPELETERLVLRRWQPGDRAPFAAMNADPQVMEHFPAPLTPEESDALVDRIETGFARDGYGLWALETKDDGTFIGFTGLALQTFPAHFTPAVEVGWRLARAAWGRGYASEAARAAIDFGFGTVGLDEIVSMTAATNVRSQRVMQRIGMTRDPADDFLHPNVPAGHAVQPHVLYRIRPGQGSGGRRS
jgi:ribosomal-protein-alanine N-acetyltransferase